MDTNGARGRAHSIAKILLTRTLEAGLMEEALHDVSPEDVAVLKQEIQTIASEHAQQAAFYKALEVSQPAQCETWADTVVMLPDQEQSIYPGKAFGNTGLGYWIGGNTDLVFYTPTHLPSGYGVGGFFYSLEQCERYIRALASCMNWNQPRETLLEDPTYQPDQFRELHQHFQVEDATETAGGGRW